MNSNRHLVIFDFCDTLVTGQTADPFLRKALSKFGMENQMRAVDLFNRIGQKLRLPTAFNKKKAFTRLLRGHAYKDALTVSRDYARDTLTKNIKPEPLRQLRLHLDAGHHVIIVSGAFTCNIEEFIKQLSLPNIPIIANDFGANGQTMTGRFEKPDCMGLEKIRRINLYLKSIGLRPERTTVFSDHESDMPLFAFADEKVIVGNESNSELRSLFPWKTIT